jgi:predicted hydrocarbon binding protein
VSECFGVPLVAVEILCQAKADGVCRFVLAHPNKVEEAVQKACEISKVSEVQRKHICIPQLLETNKVAHYATHKKGKTAGEDNLTLKMKKSLMKQPENVTNTEKSELEIQRLEAKSIDQFNDIFGNHLFDPQHGTVKLSNERYIFIRGGAVSIHFYSVLRELFPPDQQDLAYEFATNLLYDFGRSIGKSDGRYFCERTGSVYGTNNLRRIMGLPQVLAHTGWGVMNFDTGDAAALLDPKNTSPILKFSIQGSIEAAEWGKFAQAIQQARRKGGKGGKQQRKPNKPVTHSSSEGGGDDSSESLSSEDFEVLDYNAEECSRGADVLRYIKQKGAPVCTMSAGYCMGYLNECFKNSLDKTETVRLGVVEVSCEALGHDCCEFVAAPIPRLRAVVSAYLEEMGRSYMFPKLRLHLVQPKHEKKGILSRFVGK